MIMERQVTEIEYYPLTSFQVEWNAYFSGVSGTLRNVRPEEV